MRIRDLWISGKMGSGEDFCPSAKDSSRPADQKGWRFFRASVIWISLLLVLWASAGLSADAQDQMEELTKKMEEMQKKLEAAQGDDPNRMMELANEMQDLSAQVVKLQAQMAGKSAAGASSGITSAQGKAHPWLVATPPGYLAWSVKVTVYNHMEEVAFGRIYTGIIPETGEEFVRSYLLFDYTAKAEGALLYKQDYSEYRMDATGDNASVNIQALTGYTQRQVQTSDERMLSVSSSSFPNLSVTLELGERFIVTPQLMEAFAEQGRLDKTFAWRTFQPNGRDYVDNLVRIQIEIGDAPEEQTWRVSLSGMDLDDLGGTMFWMKEAGKIKQVTFD